jgi:hypothetical protein
MFKIGDKVIINPRFDPAARYRGVICTVKKVPTRTNEVNYLLGRVGGGRDLRARASMLLSHDETRAPGVPFVPDAPYEPRLRIGTVVLFSRVPGKLHVITGDYTDGTYKLFELGGSDRFWRHVSRSYVDVVDVAHISIAPKE